MERPQGRLARGVGDSLAKETRGVAGGAEAEQVRDDEESGPLEARPERAKLGQALASASAPLREESRSDAGEAAEVATSNMGVVGDERHRTPMVHDEARELVMNETSQSGRSAIDEFTPITHEVCAYSDAVAAAPQRTDHTGTVEARDVPVATRNRERPAEAV